MKTGKWLSALLLTLAGGWATVSNAQQFNDIHRQGSVVEPQWEQLAFCSDCNSGSAYVSDAYGDGCCDEGGCSDAYCEPGCDCAPSCCEPCAPPWAHRTGVWASFLYLHATGADMHHAQQQNGTGGAGTTPFGLIGVADPDHEPGFRLGGSICCDMCTSVAVNYTFFESSAIDSLDIPAGVGGGLGTVGSLVHHPQAAITSSAGPVDAQYDLKMQMLDADYRRLFRASNCGWMNYSVGARYARLEQDFRQLGTFAGSSGGVIDTTTQVDFDGTGLRVGLDGERILRHGCFSAYGNLAATALVGSFRGDYRMHNATTVTDLAIVRWEDDRIVPMIEYEVGLAWTSCSGCCRAKIGYTAIHYLNVVTTPEFVDAVQADNYVDIGDSLSFSGLSTSFEVRF